MEQQQSTFRWLVLILLFLNILLATVTMNCIPPLFKEIVEEIPLSKAEMGSVMGVLTLASLFLAPIGGGLGDKYGSRWVLGTAVIIVALAGALRARVESVGGLIISMFCIGTGMAILGPNMPKVLGMWFPQKELALANGLCISGMGMGGAIGMGTAASLLSPSLGGWRNTMLFLGGIVLTAGIVWLFLYRDRRTAPSVPLTRPHLVGNFKKVLKTKGLWLLSLFYGLTMIGFMALITFLPVSLEERGVERAGELVSLMMGTTVVFNILGGIASDKVGRRKPFLMACATILGLCILTLTTLTGVSLLLNLIIVGAALGTIAPVLLTIPVEMEEIGPGLAASATGLIFMVGNTGGFFGPVLSGKLMDVVESPAAGFAFMAVSLIMAAVIITPLAETGRSRKEKDRNPSASLDVTQ